jgi:hypothetical protein
LFTIPALCALFLRSAPKLSIIRKDQKLDREHALAKSQWSFKIAIMQRMLPG